MTLALVLTLLKHLLQNWHLYTEMKSVIDESEVITNGNYKIISLW